MDTEATALLKAAKKAAIMGKRKRQLKMFLGQVGKVAQISPTAEVSPTVEVSPTAEASPSTLSVKSATTAKDQDNLQVPHDRQQKVQWEYYMSRYISLFNSVSTFS